MSSLTFRKVRAATSSDHSSFKVELFRDIHDRVCAWFIGPVRMTAAGVTIPYLARSKSMTASVAIVRAIEEAKLAGTPLCIIDPDDLWDRAWQG